MTGRPLHRALSLGARMVREIESSQGIAIVRDAAALTAVVERDETAVVLNIEKRRRVLARPGSGARPVPVRVQELHPGLVRTQLHLRRAARVHRRGPQLVRQAGGQGNGRAGHAGGRFTHEPGGCARMPGTGPRPRLRLSFQLPGPVPRPAKHRRRVARGAGPGWRRPGYHPGATLSQRHGRGGHPRRDPARGARRVGHGYRPRGHRNGL